MEKSAIEKSFENEENKEVLSWEQKRSTEQLLGFIARREAFLDSQSVELNLN